MTVGGGGAGAGCCESWGVLRERFGSLAGIVTLFCELAVRASRSATAWWMNLWPSSQKGWTKF